MIEVTGRRGTRCKQLLDERKKTRRYCKLEEEALDCTWWRTCFGRGHGPVVRQTAERSNKRTNELTERMKLVFLKVRISIVTDKQHLHATCRHIYAVSP